MTPWRTITICLLLRSKVKRNTTYFGVIDMNWRRTEEFAASLGIRTANDKSLSIQLAVGFRIFACDNLAFSGDIIALKRKHTAGLNLSNQIARAFDR